MATPRRVAWITGAGRGIGRACALALAKDGFDVGLSARTTEELRATAEACMGHGGRAYVAPCDVTKPAALEAAHRDLAAKLGPVEVLVHAAGLARSAPFLKTSEEFLDQHWRINVVSAFHAAQLVLPGMVERRSGRIIAIASTAAKVGAPYIAAYATSKHALLGLTRSLAAEFAGKGITVNAVCPGYVRTQMTEENLDIIASTTRRSREEALAHITATSPQKRLLEPEEVAGVVAYLASPAAQGINGQALTIDGGAVQW